LEAPGVVNKQSQTMIAPAEVFYRRAADSETPACGLSGSPREPLTRKRESIYFAVMTTAKHAQSTFVAESNSRTRTRYFCVAAGV
jgi:hypothetical protein